MYRENTSAVPKQNCTLLHFNEPKHNRITKHNRICFSISVTACKHEWKPGLNSSRGTGHCLDQEVPPYHGQNGFTAELFVCTSATRVVQFSHQHRVAASEETKQRPTPKPTFPTVFTNSHTKAA